MSDNIVPINRDVTDLLDKWLEAERNGEQFPVPLHDHWDIAGISISKMLSPLLSPFLNEISTL
jgi:hypothetical protein